VSARVAGLVVALPEECRSLTARRVRRGDCFDLGDARLVCVAGVGRDNAARAAHRLIERGARGLVSWGCAAALSPALEPGDLCLPTAILDMRAVRWTVSPAWQERAQEALQGSGSVYTETLITADRLAATAANKRDLAAQFGAIALDMESAAIAAVARRHGLPFLAVRAIADPAEVSLPRAAMRALDAAGTVRRIALFGEVLRHPGELSALLRVAVQFRAALRTLGRTADRMGAGVLLDASMA
jgi:adenosylhomocysteine nucleosidase